MRNPPALPVAQGHSPLVVEFDAIQREQGITSRSLAKEAGIAPTSPRRWRGGVTPTIANFDAALRVMGFKLKIVPNGNENAPL